jgi:hypothetical protein
MLRMDYTTTENAIGDAQALLKCATVATTMETFTARTVVTLHEEEMAVHAQPYPPTSLSMLSALQPFTNSSLVATSALSRLLDVCFFAGPRRLPSYMIRPKLSRRASLVSPNLGQTSLLRSSPYEESHSNQTSLVISSGEQLS